MANRGRASGKVNGKLQAATYKALVCFYVSRVANKWQTKWHTLFIIFCM